MTSTLILDFPIIIIIKYLYKFKIHTNGQNTIFNIITHQVKHRVESQHRLTIGEISNTYTNLDLLLKLIQLLKMCILNL